jgi:inositol polyphosphate 5-phosphatase INPP5B/F
VQVLLQYKFIPKPNETRVAKPWLSITPEMGVLAPGALLLLLWPLLRARAHGWTGTGERADLSLRALVGNDSVGAFGTSGSMRLDDILVLHLENGKDFFVRRSPCARTRIDRCSAYR